MMYGQIPEPHYLSGSYASYGFLDQLASLGTGLLAAGGELLGRTDKLKKENFCFRVNEERLKFLNEQLWLPVDKRLGKRNTASLEAERKLLRSRNDRMFDGSLTCPYLKEADYVSSHFGNSVRDLGVGAAEQSRRWIATANKRAEEAKAATAAQTGSSAAGDQAAASTANATINEDEILSASEGSWTDWLTAATVVQGLPNWTLVAGGAVLGITAIGIGVAVLRR